MLPHQVERLRQLQLQDHLRRHSLVDLLTRDPLKSELMIGSQQADELREAEREIEAILALEIAELRAQSRQRLLQHLNAAQRDRIESLLGPPFGFGELDQRS